MALIKQESRSRFGINWYDSEDEAVAEAQHNEEVFPLAVASVNLGFSQAGRSPDRDLKDEDGNVTGYAVIVP
jgi:hypothetical protein